LNLKAEKKGSTSDAIKAILNDEKKTGTTLEDIEA